MCKLAASIKTIYTNKVIWRKCQPVSLWLHQGCPSSPVLFVVFKDRILRCSRGEEGVWFGNLRVTSGGLVHSWAWRSRDESQLFQIWVHGCELEKGGALPPGRRWVSASAGGVSVSLDLLLSDGELELRMDRRIGEAGRSFQVTATLNYGHRSGFWPKEWGRGYKQLKWVSFRGGLGSDLERGRSSTIRRELGVEPLLFHIERSQLRWFIWLECLLVASLWRFFGHIHLGGGRPRTCWSVICIYSFWPVKVFGPPRRSWQVQLGGGMSGFPFPWTWYPHTALCTRVYHHQEALQYLPLFSLPFVWMFCTLSFANNSVGMQESVILVQLNNVNVKIWFWYVRQKLTL